MYFVIIGMLIILANLLGFGPMASWTWDISGDLWKFCVPFGLAAVWWAWADTTGYTKKKAMEREDARRRQRIDRNKQAMGTSRSSKTRR